MNVFLNPVLFFYHSGKKHGHFVKSDQHAAVMFHLVGNDV